MDDQQSRSDPTEAVVFVGWSMAYLAMFLGMFLAYGEVFGSVGGPIFLVGLVFWIGRWAVATAQTYRYHVEVAGSSSRTAALLAILFAAFTILVPGGFFLWANAHRLARKHDL